MKKPLLISVLLGLALLSINSLAAKEGYYRWQDDKGEMHFTQQPPVGRSYTFIETRSGASLTSQMEEQEVQASEDQDPSATRPQKMEVVPPKNPKICEQARGNMSSLQLAGARIRVSNADGSSRYLNDQEIEEQKNRARQAISLHCD